MTQYLHGFSHRPGIVLAKSTMTHLESCDHHQQLYCLGFNNSRDTT